MTREEKGTEKELNEKAINKVEIVRAYLSIITVNLNGLNFPIKRHRVAEWKKKKKKKTNDMLPIRDSLKL